MQQKFIKKTDSDTLNLIFLGYGQDERAFYYLNKSHSDTDIALIYDYSDLKFSDEDYQGYQKINLIAWSMGVMIAPRVIANSHIKDRIVTAYAVNGTKEGIDDTLGIPENLWDGTIAALSEKSVLKFYRRMCGDAACYENYIKTRPDRSVESLKTELCYIKETTRLPDSSAFSYTRAFIGAKDRIFAPQNQKSSWEKHKIPYEIKDIAHYSPDLFVSLVI